MRADAVSPNLLALLRELMQLEELSTFSLGGGTSLSLRFGYRKSDDIDLFSREQFNSETLLNCLRCEYPETEIFNRTPGSLSLVIRGVKVDVLHHAYNELEPPTNLDHIRCVSLKDISAMKINSVTNRGSKKDFSDLLFLHQNGIEVREALDMFCHKYGPSGRFLAIRSLQFFDDARLEPDPLYLNDWTWDFIEAEMRKIVVEMV